MKVLLLAEHWTPGPGGIQRYLRNIIRYLPADKKVVVAPKMAGGAKDQAPDAEGVAVLAKKFYLPFVKPKWLPLYWYIKKLVKRDNVSVLLCGKALFEGLLGHYLKKSLGIPYVVFTYAMEISEWMKNPRTKKKLEKVLSTADVIVYINERTKRQLIELGAGKEQLVRIPPGVEDRFFESAPRGSESHSNTLNPILEKHGITKPYVLSVGRLIPRKGFDDLIRGFAGLDQTTFGDVELVIVGGGSERARLEKLAEQEMVAPKFLGEVPDEDLVSLFGAADVFALTPKDIEGDFEGFGIVYLEANAAGVPVIATHSGGAAEAVVDGKTGLLVDPEKPAEITKALETLLSADDLRKTLGEQGKVRARDEFSWERQAKRLQEILETVTAS